MKGAAFGKLAGLAAAAGVLVWLAGFVAFLSALPAPQADAPKAADAIAVLTGGKGSRIQAGMALLAAGAGERLMISGVGADTADAEVMQIANGEAALFACCVDLGRSAQDTIGNAREIGAWAEAHNFRTLIVVTSDYHMPRTLMLLKARMPAVALTGFPTEARWGRRSARWLAPGALAKLGVEYNKYLATRARLALAPAAP